MRVQFMYIQKINIYIYYIRMRRIELIIRYPGMKSKMQWRNNKTHTCQKYFTDDF